MTNRIVGGWGLNSCGLDATIPFSTVARRWQTRVVLGLASRDHRGTASWGMVRMRSGLSNSSVASDGAKIINQKETAPEPECKEAVSPSILRASRRRAPRRNGLTLAGRAILLNWFSRDTAMTVVYFCHSSDARGTSLFVTLFGPLVR